MAATCPECDSDIDIDEADVDLGDEMTCSECGALLRVLTDSPLELESAEDDDDEEEDEEDEDGDEDAEEDVEDDVEDGTDRDEH